DGADLLPRRPVEHRLPIARARDLAPVDPQPGYRRIDEGGAYRGVVPVPSLARRDTGRVQLTRDRQEARALEHAARHLPNGGRLLAVDDVVPPNATGAVRHGLPAV